MDKEAKILANTGAMGGAGKTSLDVLQANQARGIPQWERDMEDEAAMFPALVLALRKTVAGLARYENQKSFACAEDLAQARKTLAEAEALNMRDARGNVG